MKESNDDELRFVTEHYKEGRLDTDAAWRRLEARRHRRATGPHRRRWAVAASVALAIGMAVAGGVMGYLHYNGTAGTPDDGSAPTVEAPADGGTKVFVFDKEPVGSVMRRLSDYYGRRFEADDTTRFVSGEIEAASPEEAAELLERTLGITITVR